MKKYWLAIFIVLLVIAKYSHADTPPPIFQFNSPLTKSGINIGCQLASGSQAGCLSFADWVTFNSKQNALGYVPVNKAGDTMTGNLALGTHTLSAQGVQAGCYQKVGGSNACILDVANLQLEDNSGNPYITWRNGYAESLVDHHFDQSLADLAEGDITVLGSPTQIRLSSPDAANWNFTLQRADLGSPNADVGIWDSGSSTQGCFEVDANSNGSTVLVMQNCPSGTQFKAPVDLSSHKLTSVTDPTNAQDAMTKHYADATYATLAASNSCSSNQWANSITGGVISCSQPAYSSLSGTPTIYYQTVQSNTTAQTQRANLNFSTNFTSTDSSANNRTTIDLASTITPNTTGTASNITASSNTSLTSLANLATVGTIGTGVWQGTAVGTQYGGTGIDTHTATGYPSIASGTWSTASAASTYSTLYETVATTLGDVIYGGASGAPTRLAGSTSATAKMLVQTGNGTVSAAPGWVAVGGDCTMSATGSFTCTKTNGTSFAASATTDTTNASNISSGTLSSSRLPSDVAYTDVANGFTKNQSITGSADQKQLLITGNATQTNNLLELDNSTPTAVFSVSNTGAATAAGLIQANAGVTIASGQFLTLSGTTGSRVPIINGSQQLVTTGTTSTQLGYLDADTSIQKQFGWNTNNLGLSTSVASNALTINLLQADGSSNAGSQNPIHVPQRSSTLTTGSVTGRTVTASLSIVVPSGASLGQTSAVNQYVWVYVLDDAGTEDLCVSGVTLFNPATTTSVTAITSGATSGSTMYCGSAHTGAKAFTIAGRLLVNETTAGTWASNATDIQVKPVIVATRTEPVSTTLSSLFSAVTTPPGKATTTTSDYMVYWRDGAYLYMDFGYSYSSNAGATAGSGVYLFTLPNSYTANTTLHCASTTPGLCGAGSGYITQASNFSTPSVAQLYDSTHLALTINSAAFASSSAISFASSSATALSYTARIPIAGWSQYGP